MKKILLSQNKFALVDDDDYSYINQWRWSFDNTGYAVRCCYLNRIDGKDKYKKIYMHREIMKVGEGIIIDHINRNSLDNRKQNLRFCTKSTNGMNRGKNKNNTSGFKGVEFSKDVPRKKPWLARITTNRKKINLGRFATSQEASLAYEKATLKYHGEFAFNNKVTI